MSREHWCEARGCGNFAIPGEKFCDPCLEKIEEGQIKVTDLGRTTPAPKKRKPKTRPDVTATALTPEQKMANVTARFNEASEAGDRYRMYDHCYQARRLCKVHGLDLPEWARPASVWRVLDMVKGAAYEAGAAGLAYDEVLTNFREGYANGAIDGAGAATKASRMARLHRNTLGRYRNRGAA